MNNKKESSIYNVALVHFLTAVVLSILVSFIAAFAIASIAASRIIMYIIPSVILVLTTMYSAHYITTTYVIRDAGRVAKISLVYYIVVAFALNTFNFVDHGITVTQLISTVITLAIFYGVSVWRLKNDVA